MEGEEFGDMLGRLLAENHTSVRRLERLSGVSRRTVENWLRGTARRPRQWEPVLRVALALHLSAVQTDALLRAAGHPALVMLLSSAHSPEQTAMLALWAEPAGGDVPRPASLPAQLTSFIGRDGELSHLVNALTAVSPASRLITLTGEGGSGKTRLALRAADALSDAFPDGVWLVELEALTDPALLPSAIASALGLVEHKKRPLPDALASFFTGRRALLLLDNCEHLLAAVAPLAHRLLRQCPRLCILTTSRERLSIPGETVWQVPAMALPPPEATRATDIVDYDAVRLFVERASAALPGFILTDDNAAAVAQVCRRLDGIPLALELAAARVPLLRVEQIAARLDDRFALLTGGGRVAPPRQQTLRNLIDWSHQSLSPPEQQLLRRLSVFSGGFSLAAAEATAASPDEAAVFDTLESLVAKSLVVADRVSGREAHYSLHETIRHYSHEKLRAAGETAAVMARHATYYTLLLEETMPRVDFDDRWFERLDWLEQEYDNWQAVLSRALDTGMVEAVWGARVAARLAPFWLMAHHLIEGRRWLEAALARAGEAPPATQAMIALWMATLMTREQDPQGALLAARGVAIGRELDDATFTAWGLIALSLSDLHAPEAAAQLAVGLALAGAAGDHSLQSGAHYALARLALYNDAFDDAVAHGEHALALACQAGNRLRQPYLLRLLGVIASWQGDSPRAMATYEEALAMARNMHAQGWIEGHILNSLGEDARRQRQYERALGYYRAAQAVARRIGDMFLVMGENLNMGLTLVRDGAVDDGEALLREDLRQRVRHERIDHTTVWNLWGLALVAAHRGDPARAARLFSGAVALSQTTGFRVAPADRAAFEADYAAVRAALGESAAAHESPLDRAELLAYALGD